MDIFINIIFLDYVDILKLEEIYENFMKLID